MNPFKLWRAEPALVVAVVLAIAEAFAVPDAWQKVIVAVATLVGGGVVRSQVSPATTIAPAADGGI